MAFVNAITVPWQIAGEGADGMPTLVSSASRYSIALRVSSPPPFRPALGGLDQSP
jgi:hypothetical protein